MSKTQASSPFKGGEPVVHHERAARALERLGILCYDVAKPKKECGCQRTVFTNSQVGTKIGGRPLVYDDAQQKQENQVKALRNFISQGVDYILFTSVVSTGWDEVLKEVNEASRHIRIRESLRRKPA